METPAANAYCVNVDAAALRAWPLPMPSADGDKEVRGHVLILGGSREMPGAVILAATAALRAGAGKLTIATGASVAQLVALALPEARVIGLAETEQGGFTEAAVGQARPAGRQGQRDPDRPRHAGRGGHRGAGARIAAAPRRQRHQRGAGRLRDGRACWTATASASASR